MNHVTYSIPIQLPSDPEERRECEQLLFRLEQLGHSLHLTMAELSFGVAPTEPPGATTAGSAGGLR